MSQLSDLAQVRGTTLAAVAARANVSPRLLEQAAEGIQPLPLPLVPAIAKAMGVDQGEVLTRVQVTTCHGLKGTPQEGVEMRTAYTPWPVPFGSNVDIQAVPYRVPSVMSSVPTFQNPPGLWVGVEDVNGAVDGTMLFDRVTGQLVAARPFSPAADSPVAAVLDAVGYLWFGCASGAHALERVSPQQRAVVHERANASGFNSLCTEPGSGSLWATQAGTQKVAILDLITGEPIVALTMTSGVAMNGYGMVAVNSVVYVAANIGGAGRVFAVTPQTMVIAPSTGTVLGNAKSIATDGTFLYAADDVGVWRIPISTLVAPASRWFNAVTANPTWSATHDVCITNGALFLAGTAGANTRVVRVNLNTAAQAEQRNLGGAGVARLVPDGATLWCVDPGSDVVRRLNPASLAVDLTTLVFPVGCTPRSAVVTP